MRARTRLAAVCMLVAPFARADVIVVDPGGGPGAAQLQAALDAAHDGDILLLRAGDYSASLPPTSYGKSLVVLADAGQDVTLPGLSLDGVPGGGLAFVRGLRLQGPTGEAGLHSGSALEPGGLWVEDCEIFGADPGVYSPVGVQQGGTTALAFSNFAYAMIARCQLRGGPGRDAGAGPGGEPLLASPGALGCYLWKVGTVVFSEVDARGGDGGDGPFDPWSGPADGGHALELQSCSVEIQGGFCVGGDEGSDNVTQTHPGSAFRFTYASVGLRDVVAQPGVVHGAGTAAPTIINEFSTIENRPAPARVLAIESPVREFGAVGVHVSGQPGDLAWLLLSSTPGGKVLSGKQGAFMLEASLPVLPVLLGPTDATGGLDAASLLPALPVGVDGTVLFAQLVVLNGSSVLLGTSSSLVWISASY